MKSMFEIYYKPTADEIKGLWKECIFVFDANVILNLYRYTSSTREQFISIMEKLSERIWLPHQAALEYQSNRISVILEHKDVYKNIENTILDESDGFLKSLEEKLSIYKKLRIINTKDITSKFNVIIDGIRKEISQKESEYPDLLDVDLIRDKLSILFNEKIGVPYDQTKLKEIHAEGIKRYEVKKPPGYKDEKDKKGKVKYYKDLEISDMFGDLIVWNQILDMAEETRKPIVFITDDAKEDWWQIVKGKTIGPRLELLNEFNEKVGTQFYMYQPDRFTEFAQEFLKEQINTKAVQEIKELRYIDKIEETSVDGLIIAMHKSFKQSHALELEVYEFLLDSFGVGEVVTFSRVMNYIKALTNWDKGLLRKRTVDILKSISSSGEVISQEIDANGHTHFVRINNHHDTSNE